MKILNSVDINYSYFQTTDKKFHNPGTLYHPASRLVYVPSPLWMTELQHIFNFVNQTNHPENIAMTKLTATKKTYRPTRQKPQNLGTRNLDQVMTNRDPISPKSKNTNAITILMWKWSL